MHQAAPDVEEIFSTALELHSSEDRASYLDQVCGDPGLRCRVERLLALDAQATEFLESPAPMTTVAALPCSRPGVEETGLTLGPYTLLEPIGEGGMGIVYRAAQTEPVRRQVALKVIKPGMDTRQVIARFEAERQALAMMDHPNIARVLDAGTTASGRPYFVMELVQGISITEYCDQARLTIRERLILCEQVCRAVQHAHQKGVIHRDLKPSNILITRHDGVPVPKVIDFGIAKATDTVLTDKTLLTSNLALLGTPVYMSPEQADPGNHDVDTRSDIYSLGVLIYELLTGTTPIARDSIRGATYDEIRRHLQQQDPAAPSLRLGSRDNGTAAIAHARRLEPRQFMRQLRGELDWIVMKCLEKDRARRYQTANGLARDLTRYLGGEPVEAGPPRATYRLRKTIRRHRVFLTTTGLVMAALATGMTLSAWQAIRATHAESEMAAALELAEARLILAERHVYASTLRQASAVLEDQQIERAQEILHQLIPEPGEVDYRDFAWHYLWRLSRNEVELFWGHEATVSEIVPSAEGRFITSVDPVGPVQARDAQTGKLLVHLDPIERPNRRLRRAILSSDGTALVEYHRDPRSESITDLIVRNASTGAIISQLPGYEGHHHAHAVFGNRSGRRMFTTLTFNSVERSVVRSWDFHDASSPRLQQESTARRAVLSTDGSRFAVLENQGTVTIRDSGTGVVLQAVEFAMSPETVLALSSDGRTLVVAPDWTSIILRDLMRDEDLGTIDLGGPLTFAFVSYALVNPTFTADGSHLICLLESGEILVVDRNTLKATRLLEPSPGRVFHTALSPDGRYFAYNSMDSVRIHIPTTVVDLQTLSPVSVYPHGRDRAGGPIVFAPDGNSLWVTSAEIQTLSRWYYRDRPNTPGIAGHKDEAWALTFSPDGRTLASGSNDTTEPHRIKLWDVASGELVAGWKGHDATVTALAFSPDGRTLASGSLESHGLPRLWDVATRQESQVLLQSQEQQGDPAALTPAGASRSAIRSLAYSPDGTRLATVGSDQVVRLWDSQDGRLLQTLTGHSATINSVTFSPDGSMLVTASNDKSARVWDLRSGQLLRTFEDPHNIRVVAFSPDGRKLAIGDEHGDLVVRQTETWEVEHLLNAEDGELRTLAYAPDGRVLAAAGNSMKIHLWDTVSGMELLTFKGHTARINALAFSPDGRLLASADHIGAVKLWSAQGHGQ